MTHAQLRRYVDWRLLADPDESGRWDCSEVERLIAIKAAEREARSMPRRVVLLRGDYLQFPVPDGTIRRALLEFIPSVTRPAHKLWRVAHVLGMPGSRPEWPRPDEWAGLVRSIDRDRLASVLPMAYNLATNVLPARARARGETLTDTPFEELVLIAVVLDAWRLRH